MKRQITTALLAVFTTVAVQAASMDWTAAWIYSPNPPTSENFNTGVMAGTAWLVRSTDNSLAGLAVDASGNLILGAGDFVLTSTALAQGAFTGPTANGLNTAWNGQYVAMVAYDSGTHLYGVSQIQTIAGLSDQQAVNYAFQNDNGVNGDGVPYMKLDQSPSPVPEPMSMALFGVGAAVVGLRRRFAKKA